MSFRIEFTGSLVERRNLNQATSNNSLTSSSLNSPTTWEGNVALTDTHSAGQSIPTNVYAVWGFDLSSTSGGVNTFFAKPNGIFGGGSQLWTPRFTGNVSYEYRVRNPNGDHDNIKFIRTSDNTAGLEGGTNIFVDTTTAWITRSGSISLSNQRLLISWFDLDANGVGQLDYFRIFTSSGTITITDSTNTEGVAPTGGTASNETISTITNGSPSQAGPAKNFGAKVIHDNEEKVKVNYLPPADNSQDAEVSLSESEIITASSNSISVEAEGLGGAESLGSVDTNLIVKEYKEANEL